MRFDLYQRTAGARLQAPGGAEASASGRSRWPTRAGSCSRSASTSSSRRPTTAPRCSFRWNGAHNKVIRTATRTTLVCKQPDPRPNLERRQGHGNPRAEGDRQLRHHGPQCRPRRRGLVRVLLTVNGPSQPEQTVSGLGRGRDDRRDHPRDPCTPGSAITHPARPGRPGRRGQRGRQLDHARLPVGPAPLRPADRRRSSATMGHQMKTDIHPEYVEAHVRCTCGNEFITRSTKGEIHVEICSNCHPFYTGKQKLVDTGGRVERFQRRAAKRRAVSCAPLRADAMARRVRPPARSWRSATRRSGGRRSSRA